MSESALVPSSKNARAPIQKADWLANQIEWHFRYVPVGLSPKLSMQPGRARLDAQLTVTPIGIVYETFSRLIDSNLGPSRSGSSKDHLTPFAEPVFKPFGRTNALFMGAMGALSNTTSDCKT